MHPSHIKDCDTVEGVIKKGFKTHFLKVLMINDFYQLHNDRLVTLYAYDDLMGGYNCQCFSHVSLIVLYHYILQLLIVLSKRSKTLYMDNALYKFLYYNHNY